MALSIGKVLGCAQRICEKTRQEASMAIEYMAEDVIGFYTYYSSLYEHTNRKVC